MVANLLKNLKEGFTFNMLIDFHTHCFPEKIALKAVTKLHEASGGLKYHTDGTVDGLKQNMLQKAELAR